MNHADGQKGLASSSVLQFVHICRNGLAGQQVPCASCVTIMRVGGRERGQHGAALAKNTPASLAHCELPVMRKYGASLTAVCGVPQTWVLLLFKNCVLYNERCGPSSAARFAVCCWYLIAFRPCSAHGPSAVISKLLNGMRRNLVISRLHETLPGRTHWPAPACFKWKSFWNLRVF
jgi:hypothetical protein